MSRLPSEEFRDDCAALERAERDKWMFGKMTTMPHHDLAGPEDVGPVTFWIIMSALLVAIPLLLVLMLVYFAGLTVVWAAQFVIDAVGMLRPRREPVL